MSIFPAQIQAKVTGRCDNCHTMHNSQNGADVNLAGPNPTLLLKGCVECHSSETSSTYYDLDGCKVPVVLKLGSEPVVYLAGGNFWWVKSGLGNNDSGTNDNKGHNVFLGEDDHLLTQAPGRIGNGGGCTNSCHYNLSQIYPDPGWDYGETVGKYGCEGCHYPRHHSNDHLNGHSGLADTASKGWYRFLVDPHTIGGTEKGVKGYEDGLWEAGHPNHTPGTTAHNVYLGYDASHSAGDLSKGNISSFCGGCHENFDRAYPASTTRGQEYATSGPVHQYWIRHPSDSHLPGSGEYADAGGIDHLYDPLSPVAEMWPVSNWTPSGSVTPGSDCVMCLSCHRPHGSPYPDMLRWDYEVQYAGGGSTEDKGCFYCHTKKNR
ncbi:cytochrome c3 family protein [bacterium]|nr:cytochrome c3 family protein [bacterium]